MPEHFGTVTASQRSDFALRFFAVSTALLVAAFTVSSALYAVAPAVDRREPTRFHPAFAATTLSLSASGEAKVTPDMATIILGVDTTAPTAGQAMSVNDQHMTRVIAALKAAGIEARDLRTSSLSLSPQTVYEQDRAPRLTGYQASNQVTVTVRSSVSTGLPAPSDGSSSLIRTV